MVKNFDFEDNLFYLDELIRVLRRGFLLHLDTRFFKTHLQEQISFVIDMVEQLTEVTLNSGSSIKKQSHFRDLLKSITKAEEIPKVITAGKNDLSRTIENEERLLRDFEAALSQSRQELSKALDACEGAAESDTEQISEEEMRFLLMESAEEGEDE